MGQPEDLPPQKGRGVGYFPDVPNGVPGHRGPTLACSGRRASGRVDSTSAALLTSSPLVPPSCSGSIPAKGAVVPVPMRISWSGTRSCGARSARPITTCAPTTTCTRAPRSSAAPTHVVARGAMLIVEHGEAPRRRRARSVSGSTAPDCASRSSRDRRHPARRPPGRAPHPRPDLVAGRVCRLPTASSRSGSPRAGWRVMAIVPAAVIAARTKRVGVATGVVNNKSRNAALMAVTFKTLDELAPGRAILGIGAWWEPIATKVGTPVERPAHRDARVRRVLRGFFATKRSTSRATSCTWTGFASTACITRTRPSTCRSTSDRSGPQMLAARRRDQRRREPRLLAACLVPRWRARGRSTRRRKAHPTLRASMHITQIVACSVDDR